MKSICNIFCILIAISFSSAFASGSDHAEKVSGTPKSKSFYGKAIQGKSSHTLNHIVSNFEKFKSTPCTFKAVVTKVCQKKGCWMGLKSSQGNIRVVFDNYGFFVPVSLIGKKVIVQGKISKKILTLAQSKHFAKDEGLDPKTIKSPRTEYHVVATGVRPL
ncbi:MAG: DUF4920 domain-containing protein [Bacteriovoracaceae bacterium]|nr:DUF4920 domain-containing protein [Bacteriovoracaceae bacterium]